MRKAPRTFPPATTLALGFLACMIAGCGGGGGVGITGQKNPTPISVSLSVTPVVVTQGGAPTLVVITIGSTSETALVSFQGLPAGVSITYTATDTNPSGQLSFLARSSAPAGTYSITVMVNSAGQTTMKQFVMIVRPPAMARSKPHAWLGPHERLGRAVTA